MTDQPAQQPPQDLGAEANLLGALLHYPKSIVDVAERLQPDEFYKPGHQAIYRAVIAVHAAGNAPDPTTVGEQLTATGEFERCGGGPYLMDLYGQAMASTNLDYFAEIIAGKAAQRRLAEAATSVFQLAHRDVLADEVAALLEQARGVVDQATATYARRGDHQGDWIGDLAAARLEQYREPRPPAVPTGFPDLDAILDGGLRPGTFTVIGARPSVGKSILGEQIAIHAVRDQETGVLFASLEMTRAEVMDRAFAQLAKIELSNLTRHQLSEREWEQLRYWAAQLREVPLRVEDTPHMSMTKLRGLARDLTRHPAGCGLVVADYLQLMTSGKRPESRQIEVAEFSRQLKLLAKELNAPVIALAQLNREVEKRTTPKPNMADLRESGGIEQDADNILLLWNDPAREGERQIHVAKNRQGPVGDVSLSWSPHYARAGSLTRLHSA
jgi:replicative DNA helicase